jgi:hypothetical protein
MLVLMGAMHESCAMRKRVFASLLWLYAGWYAGSTLAWAFGVGASFGPILGVALGTLVFVDPRGAIWHDKPSS